MIAMIVIAAVAFFVFSVYMAYIAGKEYGQALDEAIRLLRQYDKQQDGAVR